jgi:serine/threonine protein kinase
LFTPRNEKLKFKPRGDEVKPYTLEDLFRALNNILQALTRLHEQSWMHCNIRWSNVIKQHDGSNSWFLIDFMDAAQSPQSSPSGRQLSQREHAPEIFKNDKHTVAVDIWSVGYLIKTSGRKWRDLGQEQSDFLDLLMEEDPSNRPNAAAVLVRIKQFEEQYQNQTRIVAKTRN